MNAEILSKKLNGVDYRNETTAKIETEAKNHGLVIVFGASDDLIEFRGAIHNEVGAFGGGSAFVTKEGLLENKCDNEDCPYFILEQEKAREIKAEWCPEKNGETYASWEITTDIPHHTFEVMEECELYCIGLVFLLEDVKAKHKL